MPKELTINDLDMLKLQLRGNNPVIISYDNLEALIGSHEEHLILQELHEDAHDEIEYLLLQVNSLKKKLEETHKLIQELKEIIECLETPQSLNILAESLHFDMSLKYPALKITLEQLIKFLQKNNVTDGSVFIKIYGFDNPIKYFADDYLNYVLSGE